jgi:CelD/BcsL family acetyltransferase involved in cellulose biosynthesis
VDEWQLSEIEFLREPVSSIGDIAPLWQRLERAGDNSFFVSWAWIGTWLRCLPEQIRPELLVAVTGDGEIGAAILVAHKARRRGFLNLRQLHFNATGEPAFDCIMIEHNGFVDGGAGRSPWPDFLRWFAREGRADELVISCIAEDLHGAMPRDVRLLHGNTLAPGFACALPQGGTEAILAGFSANTRQQLRRNLRDCEALGPLRIESAASACEALVWFSELKALHVASWTRRGRRHAFQHPFFETFHRALIETGAADGSVQMRRASAGGAVLGYLYDFRRNGRVYAYQSGFDDSRADLRPGYVAHLLAMEQCAHNGDRIYDFLGGDNRLKRSLADRTYRLATDRFGLPTPGLRLEAAARHAFSRLRAARSGPQPA